MKEIRCMKCGVFLGEITKGKIHKFAVILCKDCGRPFYSGEPKKNNSPVDFPDILKDILKC